jgi:hypothetical protein
MDDQHIWQFPKLYLFRGILVLLARVTKPFTVASEFFFLGKLSQAITEFQ